MSDVQGVKFEKLSKQSLCLFRYPCMPMAFKISNKLPLSGNVFSRLGHMLFCERKMLFESNPIHHTPEGGFLAAYFVLGQAEQIFLGAAAKEAELKSIEGGALP